MELFVETLSGNRVARDAVLCGAQHIRLAGKSVVDHGAVVRGDLAPVAVGRLGHVGARSVLRPAAKVFAGKMAHLPLVAGECLTLEEDCVVAAASIGVCVHIGRGSVVGQRCVLKDCCRLLPGTVLAPDTVVPPFAVFGGCPGRRVGVLPESYQEARRRSCAAAFAALPPVHAATRAS